MARTPVTFSLKDFFKSFVARTGNKTNLNSKDHKIILETAGAVIKDVILKDGDLKLFGRLGEMNIRKVKPKGDKKAPIDYRAYQATGEKKAYHFNDHSDGFIARILWHRKNAVLNDKHMWLFKPVRQFKRELSEIMQKGDHKYKILVK